VHKFDFTELKRKIERAAKKNNEPSTNDELQKLLEEQATLEAQQSVAFEDAESLMKAKLKRVSSKIYF